MTYRIPKNGVLRQLNKGDLSGELLGSKNIDTITNPGRVRVSPRLTLAVKDNDTSISNMGVPLSFLYDGATDRYWAATGIGTNLATAGTGKMILSDDTKFTSDWDNDAYTNTPTDIHLGFSDFTMWTGTSGGVLARTPILTTFGGGTSKIKRFKNATDGWDAAYNTTVSYTFNVAGGIKNLCEGFNGNLYITDDDQVNYITPAGAAVQTGSGTIDFNGRYRAIWIRSSSNKLWIGLMSFDDQQGSKGYVAEWRGTGTAADYIYDINDSCPLSCTILDDVPYIVTGAGVVKKYRGAGAGFYEVARLPVANQNIEMPGVYDDLSNSRWIHHRGMGVSDGRILISVNNLVSSGVYVKDMPSGIWEYDTETGSIHHKDSPCAASTDFGQQIISTAGAIYPTRRAEGNYLAGFGYYTDATTERKGIFYDDVAGNTNKIGSFTSLFVNSAQIEDSWQKAFYRYSPITSGCEIQGKYRVVKNSSYPVLLTITWASTTSFTTTTDVSALVGWEIEVAQGTGAGKTSHITQVVNNAGTYTVTLDETYTGATGTGKAWVNNYEKMSYAGLTATNSVEGQMMMGKPKTKVQVKTEIRASGDFEIDDLTLINKNYKPSV